MAHPSLCFRVCKNRKGYTKPGPRTPTKSLPGFHSKVETIPIAATNPSTEINGINDSDLAVGDFGTSQENTGFAYHDGKFSAFSYPGTNLTFPEDVNDRFTIVGSYSAANNVSHGFMLNR